MFGEDNLLPDKNMKFGSPKGGTKYRVETVEVVGDTVECGKLTLSNINSVILDLHRLGCKRRRSRTAPTNGGLKASRMYETRPETLDDLEFHQFFGAVTFVRVWIISHSAGGKMVCTRSKYRASRSCSTSGRRRRPSGNERSCQGFTILSFVGL